MFGKKIKFLPSRKGERYASALNNMNLNNKILKDLVKFNIKIISINSKKIIRYNLTLISYR